MKDCEIKIGSNYNILSFTELLCNVNMIKKNKITAMK